MQPQFRDAIQAAIDAQLARLNAGRLTVAVDAAQYSTGSAARG